ncbi:DUF6415 family natural product biosynthesis protein [Streptomyces kanasensis]|uniref:DUF6415 family natural product biosynthesis protein n=1 Tax=Streptomyces kanasensis TaxID=936756 RepID=UPI003703067F
MVTVTGSATTHPALAGYVCNDTATVRRALAGLRRSLAAEAVTDQVYSDLNAVLDWHADPTSDQILLITERLRATTVLLIGVVPRLVHPYPTEAMLRLLDVSARHPQPDETLGHVRRLALAVLSVLDLLGDAAP